MAWQQQQQQQYNANQQFQRQQHPNYQQYQQYSQSQRVLTPQQQQHAYNTASQRSLTQQQQQQLNASQRSLTPQQQQYNQYYGNQPQAQRQAYNQYQQRLMNAYQSSAPPVASPFLQAQQQQQMQKQQAAQQQQWNAQQQQQRQQQPQQPGGGGSDIKLIADSTPPASDDETNNVEQRVPGAPPNAAGYHPQQYNQPQQYSNMVTAQQRMQQLIASQQKMIDQFRKNEQQLRKQLGERDTHWRKTLNDSLNKKDLRIGELFEETLSLQAQTKEEQMKNVELKQELMKLRSESSKFLFSSRKLPADIPGPPPLLSVQPPSTDSIAIPEDKELENRTIPSNESSPQPKPQSNTNTDAIETEDKPKEEKKNALEALLGASKPPKSEPKKEEKTVVESSKSETETNPALAKYIKMQKLKMPMVSILNKMKMDGVDKALIAEFKGEKKKKKKVNVEENPALQKYVKMKKLRMPMVSIINKMRMDGVDKALIAAFSGEEDDEEEEEEEAEGATIDLNDPKFEKYKKMKKLKMPMNSVINKMRMDGMSKDEIDAFTGGGSKKKKKKKKDKKSQMQELAVAMGLKPKQAVMPQRVKKLKRIHWKVIELKSIKGSFWEEINKNYDDDTDMKLGAKFELEFQIRARKPRLIAKKKSRMLNNLGGRNASKARSKKDRITWIQGKRDQNIQIGLKTMGLNNEEIYDAIVDMDDEKMSAQRLETVYELTPNTDEQRKAEEKIDALGDEVEYCGPSELFHIEMSSIPEVRMQVTKWLFCKTFGELYMDRLQQVTNIIRGCYAIKESKGLKMYLRVLLQMGNLMNHGIADKSMVYGFDLESLSLLDNIKNFAGNKTLAMFVYEYSYNRYPEVRGFEEELSVLKVAVRTESAAIEQSIKQMADEFLNIDLFCRRLHDEYHPGDTEAFRQYMQQFSDSQTMKMMNLKVKIQNAQSIANNVASYYGIKLDEGKPESLFKTVHSFVDIMDKSRRGLIKMEKERQKIAAKKAKDREKKKRKEAKAKGKGIGGKMKLTISEMMSRKKKAKEEEEEKGNLLFRDIKMAAAKFTERQNKMEKRLSVNFVEKIAMSQGKMTNSMAADPIKKRLSTQVVGTTALLTIEEADKLRDEEEEDADDEMDEKEMNATLKLHDGVGSNNLEVPTSPI